MWGPDVSVVPPRTALFQFTLAASAFIGFGFLCKFALLPERPTVPREYPYSGLVKELGGLAENKVCFRNENPGPSTVYRSPRREKKPRMTKIRLCSVAIFWLFFFSSQRWSQVPGKWGPGLDHSLHSHLA